MANEVPSIERQMSRVWFFVSGEPKKQRTSNQLIKDNGYCHRIYLKLKVKMVGFGDCE